MNELWYYLVEQSQFYSLADSLEQMSIDVYDWTLVFAILFLTVELLDEGISRRLNGERVLETLSSLFTQIPFYFTEVIVFSVAVYSYFTIHEYIPWKMPDSSATFLLVLVMADFVYYVEHFCMHKVRLFWVAHSVHHSSRVFNTATAFRFSLFDPIISATFHLPLLLLGFNPIYIFAAEILIQAYQFWIHNEMVGKLGPIEWFFNTPSHHRVHHGSDSEYIDKNFGGILIVWDRLFGTFAKEEKLPKYGLTVELPSKNPITVQFFEFGNLFKDLRQAQGFKQRIGYVFRSPGWKPITNNAFNKCDKDMTGD